MIEMNPFDLAVRSHWPALGVALPLKKIRLQQADEHMKGKDVRTLSVYCMFLR